MNYSHIEKETNLKDLFNMRPIEEMQNDNSTILTKSTPRRRTPIFELKDKSQNFTKSLKVSNKKENKENKENKTQSPQKVRIMDNTPENLDLAQICSWNPSFMNNCLIPRQSPIHSLNATNQKTSPIEPFEPILQEQQIETPQQSTTHENHSNIQKQVQQQKLQTPEIQPEPIADKDNADLFTPAETYQYLTEEYKKSKLSEDSFLSRSRKGSNVNEKQDRKEETLNFSNHRLFNQSPIHQSRIISETSQKIQQTRTPLESLHQSKTSNRVRLSSSSTPSKITTITFTPKITTVSVISNKTILASTPKMITIESNQEISTICPNQIYNNFVDSRMSTSSKPFVYSQIVQNHSIHEIQTEYISKSQIHQDNPVSKNEQTYKTPTKTETFEPQKSKIFQLIEEINLDQEIQQMKMNKQNEQNIKSQQNQQRNEQNQNIKQSQNTMQTNLTSTTPASQNYDHIASQMNTFNTSNNPLSLFLQFNPKPVRFGSQRTCQGFERETHSIVSQSVDLSDLNDLNISEIKAINQQFNDMNSQATESSRRKAYSDSILLLALIGLNTLLQNDR